jgi:hypothetical protein
MATTPGGTPYVESSDLVADYPTVSLALAEHIDDLPKTIVQIVDVIKVDTFTTTSTSLVDVTGLAATITPTSATNKILVMVSVAMGNASLGASVGAILRDSTVVGGGTAAGSRPSRSFFHRLADNTPDNISPKAFTFIDSPATTSATTYKIQVSGQGTTSINYGFGSDADATTGARLASSIVLMEVSA